MCPEKLGRILYCQTIEGLHEEMDPEPFCPAVLGTVRIPKLSTSGDLCYKVSKLLLLYLSFDLVRKIKYRNGRSRGSLSPTSETSNPPSN